MNVIFTTDEVAVHERADYWHSVSCNTYFEYDCTIPDREGFGARILARPLATLNLSICENTPLKADRTRRNVARSDTDSVFVGMILEGSKHISQCGRDVVARAGEFYVADAGRPYVLTCTENKSELVVEVPRPMLRERLGDTTRYNATITGGSRDVGSWVAAYLRRLADKQSKIAPGAVGRTAGQTVDLLALVLSNGSVETVRRLSSNSVLARLRLHHAIESFLGDPYASCQDIADSAGISTRYANMLLSDEGVSLEQFVMQSRLNKCREMLADPREIDQSISRVARQWGFKSDAHFSRSFRQAFGMSARDWRHAAGCAAAQGTPNE